MRNTSTAVRQDYRAFELARLVERYAELRPQIQCLDALARLDLDRLGRELELLGFSEAPDSLALSVEAEARAALPVDHTCTRNTERSALSSPAGGSGPSYDGQELNTTCPVLNAA